eukprot:m.217313 g.217313  ORF g.217313 m.217313 type:complete len:370 (+) comp15885_c0_seq3:190-1299(+)
MEQQSDPTNPKNCHINIHAKSDDSKEGHSAEVNEDTQEPKSFLENVFGSVQSICRSAVIKVAKSGPVPRHIAFIMDGNRRFARKRKMALRNGHAMGFEKLRETLDWCLDIGVKMVTVYAFSIENFKRPKEEVDTLMELSKEKFQQLLRKNDLIQKHGICVRVLGNISLLPLDLQKIIAKMTLVSRDNTKAVLNVAMPYTSRHEISQAVSDVSKGIHDGLLHSSDINEELLERCLYTGEDPYPDLLVRTSGEVRLSDFLLWQGGYSCLVFEDVLWPEFSFWNFVWCLLKYQRNYPSIQEQIKKLHQTRKQKNLESDCSSLGVVPENISYETDPRLWRIKNDREARQNAFVRSLYAQRMEFYEKLINDQGV